MSLKQQAVRGVQWSGAATGFTTLLHTAQLLGLGWLLESDDFGLMAMVMVVVGLGQACSDLGSAALVHRDATPDQRSSLYWLNTLAGLAAAALIVTLAPVAALGFGDARITPLLWAMSAAFVIFPLGKQFEVLLQRDMRFGVLAAQEVTAGICGFAAALSTALLGGGVWALVAAFLTGAVTRTVFALAIGLPRYPIHLRLRLSEARPFLGFGLFQSGERALGFLAQRLDQILIGALLGSTALGYYSYAFQLVSTPATRLHQIVNKVAFPLFARVQDEREVLRSGFLRLLGFTMAVHGPLLIGISVTAPVSIPLILGEKWSGAIPFVMLLALVVLAKCPGPAIGSLLLSQGKAHLSFWMSALLVAISIPAVWLGGMLGDGVGVALSLLLIQVVMKAPVYRILLRPILGRCGAPFAWALVKPTALAAIMGACVLGAATWTASLPPVVDLSVQIALGVLIYGALSQTFDRARTRELLALLLPRPRCYA